MKSSTRRALAPAALVGALPLAAVPSASADEHDGPDSPAGLCPTVGFDLVVEDPGRSRRPLPDRNGLVRVIEAGKGNVLTSTAESGKSVTVTTGGSVSHIVQNEDGTQVITGTGHSVILIFPEDGPDLDGPSTKLYVGKIVFFHDPTTGYTDIVSFKGRERDISAELAT